MQPITLAAWQKQIYLDRMDVYRQDPRDYDDDGNSIGLRLRYVGVECSYQGTDNYDKHSSPVGLSKENNLFTADKLFFALGNDVSSEDVLKVRCRDGVSRWFTVAGLPKSRVAIANVAYAKALCTTTPSPMISPNSATYAMFPPTQIYSGQVKIATTGVAVPLSAQGVPLASGVTLRPGNNSGPCTIGNEGVSNATDGTGNGLIINPDDPQFFYAVTDLSLVYVNGRTGDSFSWVAS